GRSDPGCLGGAAEILEPKNCIACVRGLVLDRKQDEVSKERRFGGWGKGKGCRPGEGAVSVEELADGLPGVWRAILVLSDYLFQAGLRRSEERRVGKEWTSRR